MSADNGIYILQTKGTSSEYEYRVVHAQAIENIFMYDSMNRIYTSEPDPEFILAYFGKADVYTDNVAALMYARDLSEDYYFLEYGISTYDDFKDQTFLELIDGVKEPVDSDYDLF